LTLKILILLAYYNRPTIVKNALRSVIESTYSNWELAFCDDGSNTPGESLVREMYSPEQLDKVRFYRLDDTVAQKNEQGGSRHGSMLNDAMDKSDADIVIILCDDDALTPAYLGNLNAWYADHPERTYGYSHVVEYNPTTENYHNTSKKATGLNRTNSIVPACMVDSSQVSWRRDPRIKFPSPQTGGLDIVLFEYMHSIFGLCPFTGFDGEYKGVFNLQLGKRPVGTAPE
jgi:glycosyltransferase involved in cell wall biosynthesis